MDRGMNDGDRMVPLFIPALVALLANKEETKGQPLTEAEVLDIRDKAACVMVPVSTMPAMIETRGYEDINPDRAWTEWQVVREQLRQHAKDTA
jgi:hypothetical protein